MWVGPEAIWTALFYILLFVGGPFYIYKRRKKAKQLKAEGKLPYGKTYLGCTLPLLIFLLCIILAIVLFFIFIEPIGNWLGSGLSDQPYK